MSGRQADEALDVLDAHVGYRRDERAALATVRERLRRLEDGLREIQAWDCLNPSDPNLCADHPWLKRHVDHLLADQPDGGETE